MCGVQTYVRGGGVVRVVVRVRMDEGVRCVTMMFPCTQVHSVEQRQVRCIRGRNLQTGTMPL